jgi:hypothetical protein
MNMSLINSILITLLFLTMVVFLFSILMYINGTRLKKDLLLPATMISISGGMLSVIITLMILLNT